MMNEYEIEEALVQRYNKDDVNPEHLLEKPTGWDENQYYEAVLPVIKKYEGFKPETYIPTSGDKPTIGIGHTGKYATPGGKITEEQAEKLLRTDAKERTNHLRSMIPNLNSLPLNTVVELGQSAFRGGITGSKNTVDFINEGKFEEASKEFLNHNGYRNAVKTGRPGIRKRMEAVSNALRNTKPGTGVTPAANMTGGTL